MMPRPLVWRLPVHARAVRWSAVRRSAALPEAVPNGPVGAAHEQFFDRSGVAIPRGIVQRRPPAGPARQTAGFGRPSADAERKGSPFVVRGVDVGVGVDQQSDDSAIAVVRRPVQRGVSMVAFIPVTAGLGEGVTPTEYSAQPVPENKQPVAKGSTGLVWGKVNGKVAPRGLGIPIPWPLAHPPNVRNSKTSRRR